MFSISCDPAIEGVDDVDELRDEAADAPAAAEGKAPDEVEMSVEREIDGLAAALEPLEAGGSCCFKCYKIPGMHTTQKPTGVGCKEKANDYCSKWFGSLPVSADQC